MAVPIPKLLTALNSSIRSLTVQNAALTAAYGAVSKAANAVVDSMLDFTKIQDSARAQNAIYNTSLMGNTGALLAATGGFKNAAMAQAELAKVGLPMAGKNILDLASRMKLSGEDMGKFMNVMENSLGPANLTKQAMDSLSEDVVRGAISSRISTEKVVNALGKLDKTILLQAAFFGGGAAVNKFMTTLTTSVQPSMVGVAEDFAKMVLQGGVDYNTLQRLGIEEMVDSIAKGNMSQAQMLSTVDTAAKNFNSIVGDSANLTRRQFQAIASGPLGDLGLMATRLSESARQQRAVGVNVVDGLKTTISQFTTRVMKPFETVTSILSGAFRVFMESLKFSIGMLSLILVPLVPVIAILLPVAGLFISLVALIGTVAGIWFVVSNMTTIVVGLLTGAFAPLILIVGALAGLAAFFGFGPSSLFDSITGFFNSKERKEEQAALKESATTQVDKNVLTDFYNINMGLNNPANALLTRVIRVLENIDQNTHPPLPPMDTTLQGGF